MKPAGATTRPGAGPGPVRERQRGRSLFGGLSRGLTQGVIEGLGPGARRALAWGILAALLFLAYATVVAPLAGLYQERAEALALLRQRQAAMARLAARAPELQAELARLRAGGDQTQLLLPGASDALAAAALQGKLRALAGAAGLAVDSVEDLAAVPEGNFRRVGIRVTLSGDLQRLVPLLRALGEAATPLLVDNLALHARGDPRADLSGEDAAAPAAVPHDQLLDLSFTIFGYRGGEPPAAP